MENRANYIFARLSLGDQNIGLWRISPLLREKWERKMNTNYDLLEAAIAGYQVEHQKIVARIAEIRKRIGGEWPKRAMSRTARENIAKAQRKRWAEFRKASPRKKRK